MAGWGFCRLPFGLGKNPTVCYTFLSEETQKWGIRTKSAMSLQNYFPFLNHSYVCGGDSHDDKLSNHTINSRIVPKPARI